MFMTPIQKTNGEGGVSESPLTYTTARHMSPAPNVEFKANVNFKDAGRRSVDYVRAVHMLCT